MRAPVVLHSISSFDQDNFDKSALFIVNGLAQCIKSAGPLRSEIIVSPDFWSILERLHQHAEAGSAIFDLLQLITMPQSSAVNADNYESVIGLANAFATDGSVGSIAEQKRDMAARRGKPMKQAKTL